MPTSRSAVPPSARLPRSPDPSGTPGFIAALILPAGAGTGALAVLDHAGELILRAPLPVTLTDDARDPEGFVAHIIHFVPSLSAVTDIVVSWWPLAIDAHTPRPVASGAPPSPSSTAHLLRLLAWFGPLPRLVAPATWLAHHGVRPGSPETLRQTCARRLPGPLLSDYGLPLTDEVRAAVLLAHHALPLVDTLH